MVWKYFFQLLVLLALFVPYQGLAVRLKTVMATVHELKAEHCWLLGLLSLLLLFNDPFFALQVGACVVCSIEFD